MISVILSSFGIITVNAQEQQEFKSISGFISVDFAYNRASESEIKSGFKVEIEGTSFSTFTDSQGYFKLSEVPVSQKICDIKISKKSYLERTIKDITLPSDVVLSENSSPLIMWPGDIGAQDRAVNIKDVICMASAFNTSSNQTAYNVDYDINRDNAINISDVIIVAKYFLSIPSDYPMPSTSTPIPTSTLSPSQSALPTPTGLSDSDIATGLVIVADQYVLANDGIDAAVITPVFYNKYNQRITNPNIDTYYFINDVLTQKNTFSFTDCGKYTITVQAGSLKSNKLELSVVPKYNVSITSDKTDIVADGVDKARLTATVLDKNGKEVVPAGLKFVINSSNGAYESKNAEFTSRRVGYYSIYASVENYRSDSIYINATEFLRLELNISKTELIGNGRDYIDLSVRVFDAENNEKTNYYQPQYYVNGQPITGSRFTTDVTGICSVYALINNFKSNTLTVKALPIPLVANPGQDSVTFKSFKVALDGSLSTVPTGKTIKYDWKIVSKPSESTAVLNNASAAKPDFTADVAGDYAFSLTVSDGTYISDPKVVNVKVKDFGATTDDILDSAISNATITGYNFDDYIPLSDGWIIVKDQTQNKVIFKNVLTGEHGKEFVVNGKPNKMEFDFERELLLVSLSDFNRIAKINMKTGVISYIDINGPIREMALGERGIVFVRTYMDYRGAIHVVDAVKGITLSSISDNEGYSFMAYDKLKNNLITGVSGYSPSALGRYSFNEITNQLKAQQNSRDLGSNGLDLAISSDGKHVAFCCGSGNGNYTIFDIDSSDISKKFGEWNIGAYPNSADFSLDNKYIVASNGSVLKIFDVDNHLEISTIGKVACYYDDARFSRGGKIIFDEGEGKLCFYKSGITQSPVAPPQLIRKPTAYTTGNRTALTGFKVSLDGSPSDMGSGTYLEYKWEMVSKPENSKCDINGANTSNPSFVPDVTGQYCVSLSVYNEVGESEIVYVNVIAKDMLDTTDDVEIVENGYLDGYLAIKPVALSSGWIIAADTKNIIKIVNVLTGEIASEYQVSAAPNKISFDCEKKRIIASLTNANKIAVIDIGKNTVEYINTPYSYRGIVYGEQNIAFAISEAWPQGYISVINIEQKTILSSAIVNVYGAGLIEYDKNNNNLFFADKGLSSSSLSRYSFDENIKELKSEQYIKDMGGNGIDMSISNDGKHLVLCCGGGNGGGYTIFDVDTTDITKKFGEFNTGAYPTSGAFSSDGKYFVASNGSNLLLFNVENHYLITTMAHGSYAGDYDMVLFSRGSKIIFDVYGSRINYYKNPL